jgi:hypothetical protein
MKRCIPLALIALISLPLLNAENSQTSQVAPALAGVWENKSRFVEFSGDGRMRVILKPYYGFVYEDTGWMPYAETSVAATTGTAASDPEGATKSSPSIINGAGTTDSAGTGSLSAQVPPIAFAGDSPAIHGVAVRYAGEKTDMLAPAAILGDGMFFRFYRKLADSSIGGPAAVTTATAGDGSALSAGDGAIAAAMQGFWLASGNADALLLYKTEPADEFFSYCFIGTNYYRIRYWIADVRYKNVQASFSGPDGATLSIPKFIPLNGVLYTCITSTGTALRNFERGTFTVKSGAVTLKPGNIVYEGTAAAVMNPIRVNLSPDGTVLALGEPYLSRSSVSDVDAEIKKHNGLRRPPRKPVFGYMDLDFHWDEVEKIRNNGKSPSAE